MSRVLSVRVSDATAEWAASYADRVGVKRQVLLENAIESFRVLCAAGTPELRSFRDEEARTVAASAAVAPVESLRERAERHAAEVRARRAAR
jgi:hypothetical protein